MPKCKNCTHPIPEGRKFCSSSCAATFNNKHVIKRKRTKRCKHCESLIQSKYTYCQTCIGLGRHLPNGSHIANRKLSYYIENSKDAGRYRSVRDHARKITASRPQVCEVCGYDKHVETCHKKDISLYPPETTIGEINTPDKLLVLCPNHHWELDHDLLDI